MGTPKKFKAGLKFGRWTTIEFKPPSRWICQCECGTVKSLHSSTVTSGESKSCGCLSREIATKQGQRYPVELTNFFGLLASYRSDAVNRGLVFEVSPETFRELTQQCCYYCGTPPRQRFRRTAQKASTPTYVYNGLDRVDNTKGYTVENLVPCCKYCNRAKQAHSQDDFLRWLRAIVDHHADWFGWEE